MTAPIGTIGTIGMATRTVAVTALARVRRRLEKTSIYLSWRWLSGGAAPRAISANSAVRPNRALASASVITPPTRGIIFASVKMGTA